MIEIKKSKERVSNCNVCGAINFDSELSFNEEVDELTEIWVGRDLRHSFLCVWTSSNK